MSQLDLWGQAAAGRDRQMRQVDEAADPAWKDEALAAIRATALALDEFISDDVWRVGHLDPPREARALGPVFRRAMGEGWIAKTNRVRPSVRSHLSGKPIWQSRLRRAVL